MLEPNKLVQDEELEALRAIFEDEWTDVPAKITAWGTEEQGGWWQVKLKGEDERVGITMRGRMTKTYPDQAPPLSLIDPVNVSPFQLQTLTKLLADKAKASVGAPMIFDLADFVKDWISINHVALTTPGVIVPTLMEEMAIREEALRAAEQAKADAAMQNLQAQAEQQNKLLNEKIQLDASRKEQRAKQALQTETEQRRLETIAGLGVGEMELRELVFDSQISVDGYEGGWEMWMLFGGRRSGMWTTYLAEPVVPAVAVSFARANLPLLWVQVVDFASSFYSTSQGLRRIELLVVEIQKIIGVRHRNLATVYAVKRERSPKGWERLVILVEKAEDGGRLKGYLMRGGLGEETAKDYIQQLLAGLEALHKRLITHREITPDHIILTRDLVTGEMVLKLADCAYARKISELNRSNPFLKSVDDASVPESWLSQDEIEAPYSHTPKRDIWHAGLVFAQMIWGYDVLTQFPDLATLSSAPTAHLLDSMGEVLKGMLSANAKRRLTAEEALERLKVVEETTRQAASISFGSASAPLDSPTLPLGRSPVFGRGIASYWSASAPTQAPGTALTSRYKTDFEEVEFLGKGGFGEVVKAKNKLDGRFYAIKKVKLRPEDNEQKVYREVNSLSRFSHQYIVRYFGCWLETTNRATPIFESEDPLTSSDAQLPKDEDDESDIFKADFDDFSTRRSQSASFPRIRFANSSGSDDADSDTESDDSDATQSMSSLKARGRQVSVQKPSITNSTDFSVDNSPIQRTLFIQMEFVEKQTLREVITHGLDEDEAWQHLLQILQALAHMSSLGIVHRDLKPSNILIDASGNVKIADFGLSTTEIAAVEGSVDLQQSADLSDLTSGIGTSLYIAPEVSISRSYNEKADMYSLGIIFFEMCFAFATSMERAQVLSAVRLQAVVFPSAWPPSMKPNQRELIAWLLRHDPMTRPTATQVLQSSLLPPPEKDKEYYTAAITEITNPRSSHYPELLDSLFAIQPVASARQADDKLLDYTYDNDNDDELQVWLSVVVQRLVELFQRHGAVDDFVPLFMRETNLLAAFPDLSPVRLLDRAGQVVQLPCSGLLAMARSAARRQIERIKRYSTGRGRYSEHPAGGQPKVVGELSFDICSPLRSQVAEAELLEIADKIVLEFRGLRGVTGLEYEFHLNHETVLETVLSGVSDRARGQVLKAFKGIGTSVGFTQSRSHLSSVMHLPKHVLDELEHCCICDEVGVVQVRLEAIFPSHRRKLATAFSEIRDTIQAARAFGVKRKILFRPTLSRNAEFFKGGVMFECVRKGKQRDVIAFGGRYDHLLEHFKEPPKTRQYPVRQVYGVGMTVAVDHLARLVRKYESGVATRLMSKDNEEERSFGFWSPSRCDVYVASAPQVKLDQRLGVVGELWRAGVRADLQYDDDRPLEDVFLECVEQNILYLVFPRANRPTVKVRSVLRRTEEEIARTEVCNWLRVAIADQRRVDASYASADGSTSSVQTTALGIEAPQQEADIRLILPPEPISRSRKVQREGPNRKHRHVTKGVFFEKAHEFITAVKSPWPLFALDAPQSLLGQMVFDTSWMVDDEAWRSLIAATGFDRQYGEMIKESLREWGQKSGPFVWLYSVRENKGCLLQYHR